MAASPTWADIDRLFARALDLAPEAREAFVRSASGGDAGLVERVLALLEASEAPWDDLADVVAGVAADAAAPEAQTHIGPYRLGPLLGRGGMGAVYLAERDVGGAPQRVALKIMRPETLLLALPGTLDRFRQERHVLAGLEHPAIARLLDGGETEDGIPFLAMEYVDGQPITDYCASHALGLEARLRLFCDVARAVDFAHRRLIVHRDVKPGNILVSEDSEGRPHPKLLDFGIAKLLDHEPLAAPLTRTGYRPLTPEYAAPEQLLDGPITTATDVYALGVVLYELLVGHRPFVANSPAALERNVLTTDPPRPSSQIQASGARQRPTSAPLARSLRGDLDTICLTALRKEPEHRYPSAAALADDIERHLQKQPIQARPATLGYRTSTFVRRHRASVLASGAVFAALLVGLGATLWQAREAVVERDRASLEATRAQEATEFLAGLIDLGDPFASSTPIPAAALADSGFVRLERAEDMDPLLRADLFLTIADLYKSQGRYDMHERSAVAALKHLRAHDAPPLRIGVALGSHALALSDLDQNDQAIREAQSAYAMLREASAPPEVLSRTGYILGTSLKSQGRAEEAIVLMEDVVRFSREMEGPNGGLHPQLVNALVVWSEALADAGRTEEALRVGDEALALTETLMTPGSMAEQSVRFNFAEMLLETGHYARSEALFLGIYDVDLQKLSADHPDHANTLSKLAILALVGGRTQRAADLASRAERVYLRVYGESRSPTIESRLIGALADFRDGDASGADVRLRRALAAAPTAQPMDRAALDFARGRVLVSLGREAEGAALTKSAEGALSPPQVALLLDMIGDRAVRVPRGPAR